MLCFLFVVFFLLHFYCFFSIFMSSLFVGKFLIMNSNYLIEGGIPFSFLFLLDPVLVSWVVQRICEFPLSYLFNRHKVVHISFFPSMSVVPLAISIILLLIFLICFPSFIPDYFARGLLDSLKFSKNQLVFLKIFLYLSI